MKKIERGKKEKKVTQDIKREVLDLIPYLAQLGNPLIIENPTLLLATVASRHLGVKLTKFVKEVKDKMSSGKMKDSLSLEEIPAQTFLEILQVIDEENPNEIKIRAMKSIFLSSFSKEATTGEEELAYEMLQIAKVLSGSDILILRAAYHVAQDKENFPANSQITQRRAWAVIIAEQIEHELPELVLKNEDKLTKLFLISPATQPQNFNIPSDNFTKTPYFRLTESGYKFCEFITRYE